MLAWGPRRAVLTLGVTQTVGYAASAYLPAILAKDMASELGVSQAFVFGAFSASLLLQALLGQQLGRWVDQRGARGALAASSLIFAAGLAALALAQTPMHLAAAWLVMGVGMALGLYDIAFAGLVDWFGAEARRSITGVTLIAGFASTIGWPLTAFLEAQWGWRGACLAWAGLHVLLTLPLHLSLPPSHGRASVHHANASDAGPAPRAGRQLLLLAIAFAAMAAVGSAISAHLPPLLAALGAAPADAVAAAALIGPAQVAARLAEYALARRLHPLQSARVAVSLFPLGAAALLVGGPLFAAPFAVLYGCGNGLFTIARGSLPLALFGAQNYGARLGLISVPGRLLQAGAPVGLAVLMQGSPRLAVAVLAGLGVVGLACLLLIAKPAPAASGPSDHD